MSRRTVVSPTHQGACPGARIYPGFISGFLTMRAFRGRRRSRLLRGAYGDFVKSQDDMPAQSLGGAHRVGCACVRSLGWVYARIYERLRLYCVKKKKVSKIKKIKPRSWKPDACCVSFFSGTAYNFCMISNKMMENIHKKKKDDRNKELLEHVFWFNSPNTNRFCFGETRSAWDVLRSCFLL
jgi:hypothetical protein